MRWIRIAALYTALAMGANAALAADTAQLEAMRDGTIKKLQFHSAPKPVSDTAFDLEGGGKGQLSDYEGKYTLVNFWATWCAPCRKEMPSLANLQAELGGSAFEVVTIATGRNNPAGIRRFFEEEGVVGLPQHLDPNGALARDMAVLGLPITVILDPQGQEIARLRGDAEWDSESAKAIIRALAAGS